MSWCLARAARMSLKDIPRLKSNLIVQKNMFLQDLIADHNSGERLMIFCVQQPIKWNPSLRCSWRHLLICWNCLWPGLSHCVCFPLIAPGLCTNTEFSGHTLNRKPQLWGEVKNLIKHFIFLLFFLSVFPTFLCFVLFSLLFSDKITKSHIHNLSQNKHDCRRMPMMKVNIHHLCSWHAMPQVREQHMVKMTHTHTHTHTHNRTHTQTQQDPHFRPVLNNNYQTVRDGIKQVFFSGIVNTLGVHP